MSMLLAVLQQAVVACLYGCSGVLGAQSSRYAPNVTPPFAAATAALTAAAAAAVVTAGNRFPQSQ